MPHRTIIKREFADAVRVALGDLSISQASYKTQISYEYIRKMTYGHVASPEIIGRLAEGLGVDAQRLLVVAGYEQPTDPVECVKIALRGNKQLSDAGVQRIMDFVKETIEEDEQTSRER